MRVGGLPTFFAASILGFIGLLCPCHCGVVVLTVVGWERRNSSVRNETQVQSDHVNGRVLFLVVVVVLEEIGSLRNALFLHIIVGCFSFIAHKIYGVQVRCTDTVFLNYCRWFHCRFQCVWISKACASTALVTVKRLYDLRFVEKRDAHRSDGLFFFSSSAFDPQWDSVFFQSTGHRPLLVHCDRQCEHRPPLTRSERSEFRL